MTYQSSAKLLVSKMANSLLDDRIKKPISQLDYIYEDGSYSGLAYLPNVSVLEDESDLDLAYSVLVKVKPEVYEYLQTNVVFSLEDILAAETESLEYAEGGAIDDEILSLKSIIEESYTSGIDGLFTEDLEPAGIENNYLYVEETNSFEGVFTDKDKIFSFSIVDPTNTDEWELSYLDVTTDYE